jgi:subtilase family serine protease
MELAHNISGLLRSLAALAAIAILAAPTAHAERKRPVPKPNLVISSLADPQALSPAGLLGVSAIVKNKGAAKAKASATAFVLSLDRTPSADDIALGPPFVKTRTLGRGDTATVQAVLAAPPLRAGTYHLIACADAKTAMRESSERDNCRASARTLTISYQ